MIINDLSYFNDVSLRRHFSFALFRPYNVERLVITDDYEPFGVLYMNELSVALKGLNLR